MDGEVCKLAYLWASTQAEVWHRLQGTVAGWT